DGRRRSHHRDLTDHPRRRWARPRRAPLLAPVWGDGARARRDHPRLARSGRGAGRPVRRRRRARRPDLGVLRPRPARAERGEQERPLLGDARLSPHDDGVGRARTPRCAAELRRDPGRLAAGEAPEPAHEDGLWEAAADPEVWRWMPVDAGRSREAFAAWLEDALARAAAGLEVPFTVLDAGSGAPIGSTRYLMLRPEHRGLEIGWTWMARERWGTGANVEAKLLLLEHAFERHGCMRVDFKTDA